MTVPSDDVRSYQKVPSSHQADPARWVDAVLKRIRDQAHAHGFEERNRTVRDWEPVARTIYYLHFAHTALGEKGLEAFLPQAPVDEVKGILEALDTAGVKQLAQRLREALGLLDRDASEFRDGAEGAWLDREKRTPPPGGWSELDSKAPAGAAALVESELRPAMTGYLHNHHTELVR